MDILVKWTLCFVFVFFLCAPERELFLCVFSVCACHKRFARGLGERCIFMIAWVFSCVPLIIHRCCKKPTIIVVSFLFFSFHKDLSTARGSLRLLLGSQILLFLFSLPANPPPPLRLFFEADVNRCLQRAVYLSLPRLVLSSDPRVNAFQRSIILCFYRLPMEGWKEKKERDMQRLRESRK